MEKGLKGKRILAVFAVLMPILQASVLFLVHFFEYGTGIPSVLWTDEATYCAILKTWSAEGLHGFMGNAIGYYGYNGGHALVGHGSAWNPLLLWPYSIVSRIFGYSTSVMWYSNVIFLSLSLLLFVLLTKPNIKNLIYLLILEAVSSPIILYMSTGMTELLRYSYAIVLAGLIFRLFEYESDNFILRYIVTPLTILFMMQAYIFFVFIVPVYMWGILRKKKIWVRILGVILGSGISGGGSYLLFHFISSNYDTYKAEAIINALSAPNFIEAIRQLWWVIEEELKGSVLFLLYGAYGHGLIGWYLKASVLVVIYALIMLIICLIKKKKCFTYVISVFCFVLFNGAFWMLYSIEPFTLYRSTAIVFIFSLYLMMANKDSKDFIPLIIFAIGMIYVPVNEEEFSEGRYLSKEEADDLKALEDNLLNVIMVNDSADAWDSTVFMYTMEPNAILSVPAGAGVNLMFDGIIPKEAGYLFFSKASKEDLHPEWLEQDFSEIYADNKNLIDKDYSCVWEDDSYAVYKRN